MSIQELIDSGANVTIAVKASDLKDFAKSLVEQTRSAIASEIESGRREIYYTTDQMTEILNVHRTTLWRWDKDKYLCPVEVGGLRRYRKSDIDRILTFTKEQ